jgi:GNAT superfamily N-acetyltransferase
MRTLLGASPRLAEGRAILYVGSARCAPPLPSSWTGHVAYPCRSIVAVKKKLLMTSLEIRIDYLANRPELIDLLAKISWEEWRSIYEQRGETFQDALRKYRERLNIDCLPLALVAIAGDHLVGTVSLKHNDLDIRPEIDPWLGALFVTPEWRGRGVGSSLMRRAVEEAARLRIPRLFLWTSSAEGLYRKLGWSAIERTDYCGQRIVIMRKDTNEGRTERTGFAT